MGAAHRSAEPSAALTKKNEVDAEETRSRPAPAIETGSRLELRHETEKGPLPHWTATP